jgi:hypothetical protein
MIAGLDGWQSLLANDVPGASDPVPVRFGGDAGARLLQLLVASQAKPITVDIQAVVRGGGVLLSAVQGAETTPVLELESTTGASAGQLRGVTVDLADAPDQLVLQATANATVVDVYRLAYRPKAKTEQKRVDAEAGGQGEDPTAPTLDTPSTELLRMASLRAPSPVRGTLPQLRLGSADQESMGITSLVDEDGRPRDFGHYAGVTVTLPMGALDDELTLRDDAWAPADIAAWVQAKATVPLTTFITDLEWPDYRSSTHVCLQKSLQTGGEAQAGQLRRPAGLLRLARLIAVLEAVAENSAELADAATVQRFLQSAQVVLSDAFTAPLDRLARPPAVADLKIVKLGAPRYEAGAIAHIENVMASETRERNHRVLEQNETTATEETERTTEQEKDLQTTSQVQLQQEADTAVQETSALQAGLTVSASYGPTISATTETRLSRTDSRDSANRTAATYSNQITQQARQKVVERIREQRVVRHLLEVEETNHHAFTNTQPDAQHVVGIYRHVEQVQDAWIEDYGKRLMLEFMVPEPAATLQWAAKRTSTADVGPEPTPPTDPQDATRPLQPSHITEEHYLELAATTGASGVKSPPPPTVEIAVSFHGDQAANDLFIFEDSHSLKVPDGYRSVTWHAQCISWGKSNSPDHSWMVGVGDSDVPEEDNDPTHARMYLTARVEAGPGSVLPVVMLGRGLINLAASVRVHCELTDEAKADWQLDVYGRILDAYQQAHEDWAARVARAEALDAAAANDSVSRSADENRAVERGELRRIVIEELLGAPQDAGSFAGIAVVRPGDDSRPTVDLSVAAKERDGILFFEQAFEWDNLTWIHYPYYWADPSQWRASLNRRDADPLWAAFLSAGASRVVAPVRPGFEGAVALYLTTGVLWAGGPVPTVGDPAYLGIAEEIAETLEDGAAPVNTTPLDPVRLPTDLVWLQPTADLNPT